MRTAFRLLCLAAACSLMLTATAVAQQRADDAAAKAEADRKAAIAAELSKAEARIAEAVAAVQKQVEQQRAARAREAVRAAPVPQEAVRRAQLQAEVQIVGNFEAEIKKLTAERQANLAKLREVMAQNDTAQQAVAKAAVELQKAANNDVLKKAAEQKIAEAKKAQAAIETQVQELKERNAETDKMVAVLAAQVRAAAAPVNAARINVQVLGDANNLAMEKELATRLRPLLKTELGFINRACELNKEQRQRIAEAGEECLQKAAHEYAVWQQSANRGRVLVVNGRAQRVGVQANPRQTIQEGLTQAVREKLSPQLAERYAQQAAKRAEYRKQLTIDNLVGMLDEKLVLSSAQRDAIAKSLSEAWDENWVPQLQMLMYVSSSQIFPAIPDQCVVPHLRDSQRTVWQGIPNRNTQVSMSFDALDFQAGVNFDDGDDAEAVQ